MRELYDMFQKDYMNILPDLNRYGEYFATNEEYIRKYRYCNAFHPFHGFSMMSSAHIAENEYVGNLCMRCPGTRLCQRNGS